MSSLQQKYTLRRLKSSYISTVVSISLVLFMLGLFGIIVLHAKKLSDYVKENIQLSVILNDNAKEVDIVQFQKTLDATKFVKSTEYITKDEAAKKLRDDLGEDFVSFLGFNPLLSSIDIRLHAAYANADSLKVIEKSFSTNKLVKEVYYQKNLVDMVNENLKSIGIIVLLFSGLLSIIAIALINNTIRLSLYAKRFLIKSMQLVGATPGFIRKPFVLKGITHGLYGAMIANALLIGILYLAQKEVPELFLIEDISLFGTLLLVVVLMGVLISWICTHMSVRKYLKSKLDNLYY